jgi:hypothetical protein
MTVFVNKEAAQNLAANRAVIPNRTVGKLLKDILSTYQGFFAARTNQWCTNPITTTVMSTAMSIVDPTSLGCKLDEQMKKLEIEGDNY